MNKEIVPIPLDSQNETLTLKTWSSLAVQKIFTIKLPSVLIIILGVFLAGLIVKGTFAYLDDQEKIEASQWMTGSLEVKVNFLPDTQAEEIEEGSIDAEAPRSPSFFQVENIGTHPFFYTINGSIPDGQPNRCQNVRVRLWKAGEGRRPVYRGQVVDLALSELNDTPFFLKNSEKNWWRYQLRYPGNTQNCQVSLRVDAHQDQEAGGFHDQAAIVGALPSLISQRLSLNEQSITEEIPTIEEKVLAEQSPVTVKRMGDFLMTDVVADGLTSVAFSLEYTHDVEGVPKAENILGSAEADISSLIVIPEQFIGRCDMDETNCTPYHDVKNMKLTLQLYKKDKLVQTLTLPLEWTDTP